MANKRLLKKQIRQACGGLAADNIISLDIFPGLKEADVNKILNSIAHLQVTALSRSSVAFDKRAKDFENRHEYNKARARYYHAAFKALIEQFNKQVHEIVKEMNAALPQEAKAANVEALKDAK